MVYFYVHMYRGQGSELYSQNKKLHIHTLNICSYMYVCIWKTNRLGHNTNQFKTQYFLMQGLMKHAESENQ